jgi:hypothetical protein
LEAAVSVGTIVVVLTGAAGAGVSFFFSGFTSNFYFSDSFSSFYF